MNINININMNNILENAVKPLLQENNYYHYILIDRIDKTIPAVF